MAPPHGSLRSHSAPPHHRVRQPSARSVGDAQLVPVIRHAHVDDIGVYGSRKIRAELDRLGHVVARCTIERLMPAEGLRGISRERTCKTTTSDSAETERPADLVERQFVGSMPN